MSLDPQHELVLQVEDVSKCLVYALQFDQALISPNQENPLDPPQAVTITNTSLGRSVVRTNLSLGGQDLADSLRTVSMSARNSIISPRMSFAPPPGVQQKCLDPLEFDRDATSNDEGGISNVGILALSQDGEEMDALPSNPHTWFVLSVAPKVPAIAELREYWLGFNAMTGWCSFESASLSGSDSVPFGLLLNPMRNDDGSYVRGEALDSLLNAISPEFREAYFQGVRQGLEAQ